VNQFYKICRIAKRSAVYLLENGIVPYIDTGKKTWKYKIGLCDVISYLIMREQEGNKISRGEVQNGNKKRTEASKPRNQENFMRYVNPDEIMLVRQFFEQTNPECPDLLSSFQVAEITGLSTNTIRTKIRLGDLQAIVNNRIIYIPRVCFYDFLLTPGFLRATSHADAFLQNLASFEAWRGGAKN
jgi:hypothetical protein